MPIYTFENRITGEQYNAEMSMADRETYLSDNPDVFQVLTNLNIGDPVRLGVTKPSSDFRKHVLGRIKEAHPKAEGLERTYTVEKEI